MFKVKILTSNDYGALQNSINSFLETTQWAAMPIQVSVTPMPGDSNRVLQPKFIFTACITYSDTPMPESLNNG